jgi:spore germination cell wall hydrolase CwlJ-like protein
MANDIAMHVMSGNLPDITDGAIRFHAIGGAPTNRNAIRIGSHLFYRR